MNLKTARNVLFSLAAISFAAMLAYRYMNSFRTNYKYTNIAETTIKRIKFSIEKPSGISRHLSSSGAIDIKTTNMSEFATVSYVTAPSQAVARSLAKGLIRNRLAACVNIINQVESIYEWEDKVEQDEELLLIIKSWSKKTVDLTDFVTKNHPYECPEVITLKVESGSQKYLNWVRETVDKPMKSEE